MFTKSKRRKKMRRSSSTLISCSSNFSNSKDVSMNRAWTWSEFCFLHDVAFLGEVACALGEGHILAAPPPWGRGQCQGSSKAAIFLPDVSAESFLELFPKFKSLLYWFYLPLPKMVRVWEKGRYWKHMSLCRLVLPAVQGVKALESKAHWCRAGEPAVWTREVWKEQSLALNQLLLRAMAVSWFEFVHF